MNGHSRAEARQAIKILIVEDDPDVLELMELVMARDVPDATTTSTAEASEALAIAEGQRPDIVILDSGVPGMSTETLAKRIAALSPSSRLVLYSAMDRTSLLERSGALGLPAFGKNELRELVDFIRAPR